MKNILCYIFLLVFSFKSFGFEISRDMPLIKNAAGQIDYLFNRNDEIERTSSEEKKWYIYFLGENAGTLKYIIEDSSYKSFSDNYLNQLNNLLTEINTSSGVVMYVGLTDYTKPIVLPFFPEGGTVLEKIEALRSRLDEVQNIQEASGSDINIGIEYLKKYKNTFGEIVDRIYEESILPELGSKDFILPVSVYHNITVNEFSKNYHSIVVKRSAALKEKDTEFQALRKSNTPPFGSTNDERTIANITDSYQKILSGNYELPIADVPIKKPFELTLCDYLPENNKVDEYGVTEAIKKLNAAHQRRNAITDTETPRNKGDFYHLINVAGGDLIGKAEVIEDKLYLLKQKTGINFYVVFQPVATKMNIGAREEFAKQVLEGSALNGSSNTILITVPFLEVLPTANFTPLSCIQPGFVQSSSSLITSQGFKEASDLFNYVFEAYKEIEKPVYLVRYFESVSGELVRLEYSSSSNLKGLPYINAVRYYRSKYASGKAELEETLSLLLSKEDVERNSSLVIDYQNQIKQKVEEGVLAENQIGYDVQNNIWQQEESIVSQNVGLYREPYITNQDLVNQFIDKSSNDWVYGVKFDIVFNNGKLSKEHFYNIDNFSIVDPAVYGLIDVAGLIPGIDNFADPIGMLYAGYRDNSENILAYSLASSITGAGAMYFKAGGEVFGVVAKLDDTGNLSYAVRSINGEVTENELQLTSSYVRQKDIAEGALVEIQKQQNDEYIKSLILSKKGVLEGVESLSKYSNIRKYIGDSRIKQYLSNQELFDFETIVKKAHPDVLKYMDEMDEFDFAEMVRGYRDLKNNNKLSTFENAIKKGEDFYGQYGWLSYWRVTPGMKYSLTTIDNLRETGKLLPIGNATDIQLASLQAFTRSGDFINVPMRYNSSFMGEYAEKGLKHIKECLKKLKKLPERKIVNERVYSGKTFSKVDFESKFVGGIGKTHNYKSFVSTSKEQSVAEYFISLTKKWASDGEKIAVIQRIVSKEGVYIDDLSDWGEHLGSIRHANQPPAIQRQYEVLLDPGGLKQIGDPIPIMENGIHITIDGMEAYYVDLTQ